MQRRLRSRALALVAAGALTFAVAACGDDDDDAGTDATAPSAEESSTTADAGADDTASGSTVVAEGFAFEVPGPVAAGSTVTFENEDDVPHTMTADEDDAFDSGRVVGGSQAEVTAPDAAGEYAFHCEVHPSMTATLTVQ